ncbi:hypothetical protein LBMAG53_07340 [Planctomycetota bacterium]|nr:hypothetical protein LBMAG53_07340 [Planctomycetota bacterium]
MPDDLESIEQLASRPIEELLRFELAVPDGISSERLLAICRERICSINRQRQERIAKIASLPRNERIDALTSAIIDPLVESLWGPTCSVTILAYRLHIIGLFRIPQDAWWTPGANILLCAHYGDEHRLEIRPLTSMINEMLSGFIARRDFLALWKAQSRADAKDEFRGQLRRLISFIYISEIEFLGKLA